MVFKRMVLLISSVFILVASGCVSIPAASENSLAVARQFAPPANKARIYVARLDQFGGGGALLNVKLDGQPMGKLKREMFIVFDVAPGEHIVSGEWGGTVHQPDMKAKRDTHDTVEQDFLPGKCYFFAMKFAMEFSRPGYVVLSVLSDDEGKKYVNEYKMAESPAIFTAQ